jgi:hypothetical protein
MTLQGLPENAQQYWLDNMHLGELGRQRPRLGQIEFQ